MKNYTVKLSDKTTVDIKAVSAKRAKMEMEERFASIRLMGVDPPSVIEVVENDS